MKFCVAAFYSAVDCKIRYWRTGQIAHYRTCTAFHYDVKNKQRYYNKHHFVGCWFKLVLCYESLLDVCAADL